MENNQSCFIPDIQSQKQRIRRLQFILLITAAALAVGITYVGRTLPPLPNN